LAIDPGLAISASSPKQLKLTQAFQAVYRRGRWARGAWLSVGALPNQAQATRVGLRTRKGLKGAVVRNRLKRQLRAIVFGKPVPLKSGLDVVVVIHPPSLPAKSETLQQELLSLCRRSHWLS
jgi:ribonuclease P protein component